MNEYPGFVLTISICLAICSCTNSPDGKGIIVKDSLAVVTEKQPEYIDTNEEINVYNGFIDQVYRIRYCHLAMDSPDEYMQYNDNKNISREELLSYKKKWNLYLKRYDEMLDTSLIIAFVSDSLYSLEMPDISLFYRLDSVDLVEVYKLLKDTIPPKSAYFILDSLKSRKIHFERPPYKYVNWDTMPIDTALKYSDENEIYWHGHVGNQVGNKYYIGAITMSRVKFNHDSTMCVLECGYMAQTKCGYGHYYILKKIKNRWKVLISSQSWVS